MPADTLRLGAHGLLMLATSGYIFFRIRRAGYPIRHTFEEFVERYRVLIPGLTLSDVKDFKYTSKMICNRVMEGHDWQIGYTKVFLKVRT